MLKLFVFFVILSVSSTSAINVPSFILKLNRSIRSYNNDALSPYFERPRNPYHYTVYSNPADPRGDKAAQQHGGGIHVASWRWDEIGVFFTFTAFVVFTGLAKIAFHHVHWLSSRVPESCLLIIIGVLVGAILFLCGVQGPKNNEERVVANEEFALPMFTPRLFFLILLPPVILESAYSLYDRSFADNLGTVLLYAVIGTILNTFLIGPLLYLIAVGGLMGIIHLNLTNAFVFSALISAVDPVAVLAIFQEVGVNKDLYYLLFGESLLNDAVTIVLYTTMVTFTTMEHIDIAQYGLAVLTFFTVSFGGLLIGILFGLVTALITKATQHVSVVEPLAVLGIAYMSYLGAELFHFSGIISIIGCGLIQAHYALKNIDKNSRVTVKYFTKMISSTSESIIFLFLGMVLVSDRHIWHTGFVLWSLFLCLVCRFFSVFFLTKIANTCRVRQINFQEQFMMAYGGLRGAVAFSLVEMLQADEVEPQPIFLTTTLVVILFTVFIQGATIKVFVNLLNIEKSQVLEKTMNEQINEFTLTMLMAGIEEITGVRGDNYLRRKFEHIDEAYLGKIFLNTTKSNSLTRLYEKLALSQHYAHLYGPVTLIENQKGVVIHQDTTKRKPKPAERSQSVRTPARKISKIQDIFPGVELRRRTISDSAAPESPLIDFERKLSFELRKAMRDTEYQKFQERFSKNQIIDEDMSIDSMLRRRHNRARRITQTAAMLNRHSATPTSEGVTLDEEFTPFRRQIHSELEGTYPEDLEGMAAILNRAERCIIPRHASNNNLSTSRRHTTSDTNINQPNAPLIRSSGRARRTVWGIHSPVRRQHTIVTRHPTGGPFRPASADVTLPQERSSTEISDDVIVDTDEESKV